MPTTKHKIFKLRISDDGKFTITKAVEKTINSFLLDPNNVYVNHSITTLTEDIEEYDSFKTNCKYVLISLIYKDLNSTPLDVKTASKSVKSIVHKQIESGEIIDEPLIETEIDKQIMEIELNRVSQEYE